MDEGMSRRNALPVLPDSGTVCPPVCVPIMCPVLSLAGRFRSSAQQPALRGMFCGAAAADGTAPIVAMCWGAPTVQPQTSCLVCEAPPAAVIVRLPPSSHSTLLPSMMM
eukprot:GHVU01206796.1.p1 GENE.GHVU01206796.1~~GHVU01206796.1.p1  ORF type:complete len:109 (+),score=10.27 GHVU01206796.1:790-1116(+)